MQLGVHEAGSANFQHLEVRGKGEEVVQVVSGEQVEGGGAEGCKRNGEQMEGGGAEGCKRNGAQVEEGEQVEGGKAGGGERV